jgi:hypothetical protein
MRPTRPIEWGSGDDAESELLVETSRGVVLFVYVDPKRVAGQAEESDGDVAVVGPFGADLGGCVRRLEATSFQIWDHRGISGKGLER